MLLPCLLAAAALAQTPEPYFPNATYDAAIPTPDSLLKFEVGSKPVTHAQIETCMKAWASTPRSRLFEYGKTHEGRTLYYLVISSEENIKKLETIKSDFASLADPRKVSEQEGDHLASTLPAIAWMAYVIHGDEMSGSDASLVLAHHLIASKDEATAKMLNDVVVIIDPLMNPDGRDRYLTQLAHDRTERPNLDDQSVLHSRPWPAGRANHYLFDMNRDWILGTQPESRGRIKAIGEWHPQLLMESHEMGSQDTFLFSPPREPVNPNLAPTMRKWWDVFGNDLATSFDAHRWKYYHGEWNEEWYPGYSSAWAGYRGCIDILFEQASIETDGVRKASGVVETYHESVHHQLVGSLSNIRTLAANRAGILKDYVAQRRYAVSPESAFAKRAFVLLPTENRSRTESFISLMRLQGFEVFVTGEEMTVSGKDQLGRVVTNVKLPKNTVYIPNRQPEARLLAAMLEFDTRMTSEFLTEERRELLRFGKSRLYDVTGWSMTMLWDLPALEVEMPLPASPIPFVQATHPAVEAVAAPTAWVFDGADDMSVAAAAHAMEAGVACRVTDKATRLDGHDFVRGSVVIAAADNSMKIEDLAGAVAKAGEQAGVTPVSVRTGLGPGDLPDMGGEHFLLLSRPRVAILTRDPFDIYSFGEAWHQLDHTLSMPVSNLDLAALRAGADLRRYNVLVVPDGGADALKDQLETLRAWVKGGGTLIAMGGSATLFAQESSAMGSVRLLPDVLPKLEPYSAAIWREWEGLTASVDPTKVWSYTTPESITFPWATAKSDDKPSDDEAKRRDQWRATFMPTGVIVAGRVDDRSWLTAGCRNFVPIVVRQAPVLMVAQGASAPVRFGAYSAAPEKPEAEKKAEAAAKADQKPEAKADGKTDAKDGKKDAEEPKAPERTHWAPLPPGQELRLRMCGLLWPEAADRLADAAYVTRETLGAGQVILFAESPNFRGAARGTMRLFSNAVVFGPGMGASQPVPNRRREE
jgi:hypothetical protein